MHEFFAELTHLQLAIGKSYIIKPQELYVPFFLFLIFYKNEVIFLSINLLKIAQIGIKPISF